MYPAMLALAASVGLAAGLKRRLCVSFFRFFFFDLRAPWGLGRHADCLWTSKHAHLFLFIPSPFDRAVLRPSSQTSVADKSHLGCQRQQHTGICYGQPCPFPPEKLCSPTASAEFGAWQIPCCITSQSVPGDFFFFFSAERGNRRS